MAQDTSGTNIKTNAVAPVILVAYKLYCDWDDLGFGVYPTGWYDESDYVQSVGGTMSAVGWQQSPAAVGTGVSNTVSVVLQNPEESGGYSGLRFSSSNANGSLYGKIGEGAVNMKRAVFEIGFYDTGSPERLAQVSGYITKVSEDYAGREVGFTIQDRGADAIFTRGATTLQQQIDAKTYLTTLVGLFERDTAVTKFDYGMVVVPYQYLDDETVWDEMGIVAESQCGRTWFDKDGVLHFDDGTHFVKPDSDSYDDPTTSQATLTVANLAALNPFYDLRSVYNHVIVEYQTRYLATLQTVYTASEIVSVRPSVSNQKLKATYRYPVSGAVTPVADTDYVAVTAGGTDITSDVTITKTTYAGYTELSITNANTDYTAYLTKLQIRGYPLLTEQGTKYEVENSSSISDYGRRTLTVRRNPYVQHERHAQMIGDLLLERFKDPVFTVKVTGVKGMPWLEPGDRVTLTESLTGLNTDFFVADIFWRWSPNAPYLMDLTLVRTSDIYANSDYFILGTSKYGTGTGKGRVFW